MINIAAAATLALGLQVASSTAVSPRFKSRAVAAVPTFPVRASWQIILRNQLQIPPTRPPIQPDTVDVWDIDLFENTDNGQDPSAIQYLKSLPKKPQVICYFSAGSYEVDRTDWPANFDRDLYGKELVGWPGEYWLDINNTAVQDVMFNRIRLAAQLGCDAVDPDNVDGYVSPPSPLYSKQLLTPIPGRGTKQPRQPNRQSIHPQSRQKRRLRAEHGPCSPREQHRHRAQERPRDPRPRPGLG